MPPEPKVPVTRGRVGPVRVSIELGAGDGVVKISGRSRGRGECSVWPLRPLSVVHSAIRLVLWVVLGAAGFHGLPR